MRKEKMEKPVVARPFPANFRNPASQCEQLASRWHMRPTLNAVQLTSLLTAFWRHWEFKSAAPLCKDPHASILLNQLLPSAKRQEFERSPLFSAGLDILACRTRKIDDWLLEGSTFGQTEQVVLLGAGMDTRAYRLALGRGATVFEVEKDVKVLHAKHETLQAAGVQLTVGSAVIVEADVSDADDLQAKLQQSGLQANRKTSWVIEGLLEYLPLHVQGHLFLAMKEVAGENGSRVGMQVLDPSFGDYIASIGVPLPYQALGKVDVTTEAMERSGWGVSEICESEAFLRVYGRRPHEGFRLVFGEADTERDPW